MLIVEVTEDVTVEVAVVVSDVVFELEMDVLGDEEALEVKDVVALVVLVELTEDVIVVVPDRVTLEVGELVALVVAVVVTLFVPVLDFVVVSELLIEVVKVDVTEVLGLVVGLVIWHSANVPSKYDAIAAFSATTDLSQLASLTKPKIVGINSASGPRVYSPSRALSAAIDSEAAALETPAGMCTPSTAADSASVSK